mgnify:CR=1 FL=1
MKAYNQLSHNIIQDLRDGYGVEDISVRGIATEQETRSVIGMLRKYNLIDQLYKIKKGNDQCN